MSRSQMCFDDISVVSRVCKRQCILQESFTYRIEERSILCMVGALMLQVGGERRTRMWQLAIKVALDIAWRRQQSIGRVAAALQSLAGYLRLVLQSNEIFAGGDRIFC